MLNSNITSQVVRSRIECLTNELKKILSLYAIDGAFCFFVHQGELISVQAGNMNQIQIDILVKEFNKALDSLEHQLSKMVLIKP